MNYVVRALAVGPLVLLAACTTMPSGPAVMALPGSGKSFDQFRNDDFQCKQFANEQVGSTPQQAAVDSGITSAAIGTAVGALAGAAFDGGSGAAIGAGVGLLTGALAGTANSSVSGYTVQQRYDNAYTQCMYAQGHKVPVSGEFAAAAHENRRAPPAPRTLTPPPPPPGAPPPPPPH